MDPIETGKGEEEMREPVFLTVRDAPQIQSRREVRSWMYLAILGAAFAYTAVRSRDAAGAWIMVKWGLILGLIVLLSIGLPLMLADLLWQPKKRPLPLTPYRMRDDPAKSLAPYPVLAVALCLPLLLGVPWLYAASVLPAGEAVAVLIRRRARDRACGYRHRIPVLCLAGCVILAAGVYFAVYFR